MTTTHVEPTDDWIEAKAKALVANWEHGGDSHRAWLRDVAIPDIIDALRICRDLSNREEYVSKLEKRLLDQGSFY